MVEYREGKPNFNGSRMGWGSDPRKKGISNLFV